MNLITRLRSYITGVLVERQPSKISGELEVWIQNGRYVLHSTKANYSFDTLHLVFQRTFRHISIRDKNPQQILVLGLGAGSIPHILYEELLLQPEITGVEADEAVIRLSEKYFNIRCYTRLNIVQAKAQQFVSVCQEKYDLVISDVFVHTEVPEEASDEEYLLNLVRLTAFGGTGLINVINETTEQKQKLNAIEKILLRQCDKVERFNASELNTVLIWQVRS